MIGVVVWSSAERQKAVIWCEDQGALAYLHGSQHLAQGADWPAAGDLLELECETVGDLRHARAVSMLNSEHCVDLPLMLKQRAAVAEEPPLRLVTSNGERIGDDHQGDASETRQSHRHRLAACR
ncbi:hypothetical protein [Paracoccus sp. M683]|uniref:hypothetical protein n=1 Tax=Paracoccus sp. M683 TaxID=2594268 RepID=UPI00163D7662|nr:hypothetical protein [Paracoccus sp. M683]